MKRKVVDVRNVSKCYRLGIKEEASKTFAESVVKAIRSPLKNLKRLQSLSRFTKDDGSLYWALRDVSFTVNEGEVVGIIGKNGAGKSTLLKIICQITDPRTGEIELEGRVGSLLEVGTGFHPELTGRENIYMNGTILGMTRKEIDRKLDEIIDFSGVEKFVDTPVKFYSSGMKVRLGFSVAAHLEPEILIIDEVLAVGDHEFQKKCLGKMEDVARHGRTVLFVSHNMAAISNLCSRVVVLAGGHLMFDGDCHAGVQAYVKSVGTNGSSAWAAGETASVIREVAVELAGKQPQFTLMVDFVVKLSPDHKPAFAAIDIRNSLGTTIMQAIPSYKPFIDNQGVLRYRCYVELPGLVPDTYYVSVWIGPHNNETYDNKEDIASFTVYQHPSPQRTLPHTLDHGSVVPVSKIVQQN